MLYRKIIEPNPIREARIVQNIDQIKLARLTKRSLSTIRNAERGLATLATLRAIASALGVTVDELTGRKGGGR